MQHLLGKHTLADSGRHQASPNAGNLPIFTKFRRLEWRPHQVCSLFTVIWTSSAAVCFRRFSLLCKFTLLSFFSFFYTTARLFISTLLSRSLQIFLRSPSCLPASLSILDLHAAPRCVSLARQTLLFFSLFVWFLFCFFGCGASVISVFLCCFAAVPPSLRL